MGQIVKKKKGRPSKADLAARAAAAESNDRHHSQRWRKTAAEEQDDVRRSLRRRSCVRYNLIDYDEDYLEDDEEFEVDDDQGLVAEEGVERREKTLKLVFKLPNSTRSNGAGASAGRSRRAGRSRSELEEEEEEEEENPVSKSRKIIGDGYEKDDYGANEDEEGAGGKGESNKGDFVHGALNVVPPRTPMPEKKQLELILDKLQKKDTYGVYAEPVDPEELPDYHDIIKHPMDFATIRKKLADGTCSNFEQFENDVYLICSNAMQYNAPDTIYHKQACTIMELAQKKFERLKAGIERTRIENGRSEREAMSEQKTKLNPIMKKQMKKPIGCSAHDPVSYGFSSGATLATTDAHNTRNGVLASNCERPSNNEGLVEGVSSFAEGKIEKVEDLQSGKGMNPKLGKKPLVVDENRRGTYEISNQPVDRSESIFSTFEGEDKQLIPVGVYGEHSYAQSLARFAATPGPIAWRLASKRIERALPPGSKFGRGWVVEYEPLPTPVLFVATQPHKEYSSATKLQSPALSEKIDKPSETLVTSSDQLDVGGPTLNGRPCFLPCSGGSKPATPSGTVAQRQNPFVKKPRNAALPVKGVEPSENPSPANDSGENGPVLDAKPPQWPSLGGSKPATPPGAAIQQQNPFVRRLQNASVSGIIEESPESLVIPVGRLDCGSGSEDKSSILPNSGGSRPITPTGSVPQPQNPFSRNNLKPENMVKDRIEANGPTLDNQKTNFFVQKQFPASGEMASSWQVDMIARNKNFLQPVPFRPTSPTNQGAFTGGFPNGNGNGSVDMNRMASSSSSGASTQVIGTKTPFHPRQEHGLSDPAQVMRLMADNAQKQQNKTNGSLGPSQIRPSIQSPKGGRTSGAISWSSTTGMYVGAGVNKPPVRNLSAHTNQIPTESLYNTTRELYPHILQPGEHPVLHFQSGRSNPPFQRCASNPAIASTEAQVQNRQMVFPPSLTDLSRVPLQSPSQGLSPHTQQKQKQDTLPPDLNIAFQSTVDPQQPDLALQL